MVKNAPAYFSRNVSDEKVLWDWDLVDMERSGTNVISLFTVVI